MGQQIKTIGALVSRYSAVVIFPSIAILSIYADLRHTRLWKEGLEKKRLEEAAEKNLASI